MFGSDAFTRKPRRGATATLIIVAIGLVVVCAPAWGVYRWWAFRHELRRDWTITGPPCPPAADGWDSIAQTHTPHEFSYGGMHLRFPFGAADCSPVPEDYFTGRAYSVCQLTAPVLVVVTAGGRSTSFEPGQGRRATVRLRNGQVSCVLGGWYRE